MNTQTPGPMRQFASDTWAGLCPEAWEALQEANHGHAPAYGGDRWTAEATRLIQDLFETDCAVFFVPTGTAANALALAAVSRPYHAVVCHEDSHIQTDECGAPEMLGGGLKLLPFPGPAAKITPAEVRRAVEWGRPVHSPQLRVISVSQATEAGTLYNLDELCSLAAEKQGRLVLHMDGARFANAVASLDVAPKELAWRAGVDVLCFGGTKNGLSVGDAIVFFDRQLADAFEYRRKQAGHLLAKLRFVTAPWAAVLRSGAWLRYARHANGMARLLEAELRVLPGVKVRYPVEASAVFVEMPDRLSTRMHERGWHFYQVAGAHRLMCSWDTRADDVTAFVQDLRSVLVS